MASSDGPIICAMRWVLTNDQEPFPTSPLELIAFRYRAIGTKTSVPSPATENKKWAPSPLRSGP